MIHRSLALWMIVLLVGSLALAETPPPAQPVEGTFVGNGQEAALQYALVQKGDGWEGEDSYTVILSEKDPAGEDDPELEAMFGDLGHALVFQVTVSGDLFGVQICHQGLEKSSISSIGTTEVQDFQIADGKLSARFVMPEEHEFFGDTWKFDLRVTAPLP